MPLWTVYRTEQLITTREVEASSEDEAVLTDHSGCVVCVRHVDSAHLRVEAKGESSWAEHPAYSPGARWSPLACVRPVGRSYLLCVRQAVHGAKALPFDFRRA